MALLWERQFDTTNGKSLVRICYSVFQKSKRTAPGLKALFGNRILRGPKGPRFHRKPLRNVFETSSRKVSPGARLPAEREKSRSLASLVMTTFEKKRDTRPLTTPNPTALSP